MNENVKIFINILKENIGYIALFLLAFCVSVVCKYNFSNEINLIDNSVNNFVHTNFVSNTLTIFMKVITEFGDYIIFGLLVLFFFIFLKNKKDAIAIPFSIILAYSLNIIIKTIFHRPRPTSEFLTYTSYSFPSAHAMCSTVLYGFLIYLLNKNTKNNIIKIFLTVLLILLILLICFSRIYLQAHYLTDVIGGVIFGIISLLIFINIYKNYFEEKYK